jgi:hypothetical protein
LKVGDEVTCKCIIEKLEDYITVSFGGLQSILDVDDIISIPKPEPKPIDFGKAKLVLKGEFSIIQTTGYCGTECFSGIYLNGNCTKGFTSNGFIKDQNMWQDITENYYLNNPK